MLLVFIVDVVALFSECFLLREIKSGKDDDEDTNQPKNQWNYLTNLNLVETKSNWMSPKRMFLSRKRNSTFNRTGILVK